MGIFGNWLYEKGRTSYAPVVWTLTILAGLALTANLAFAQDDADEEEEEALELEDVRVTGSRLNRSPSELSGNLIVLDRDDIRATGELTLSRVLRQLPQNANPTHEDFFSTFNTAGNRTGAATVNLRGLGSESTLILVDGRRVGYSGILGGVTDISTIPLSMVERIEILLDGASAVYGSDAVGGVVNIITRQDYSGVELDLEYGRPHDGGFEETRATLAAGISWTGGRAKLSYENFRDTGLDGSQRDSIIHPSRTDLNFGVTTAKNSAPGPQFRLYAHRTDDSCPPLRTSGNRNARPILWELANGNKVTHADYLMLDEAGQAGATCHADVTLPQGFLYTDDLNSIDQFGEQNWRNEADVGYSLRPEQSYDVVNLGVDQQVTDSLTLHASLRLVKKDSDSMNGLNALTGLGTTLHADNPFNPFGVQVTVLGQLLDQPAKSFESEKDEMFARLGAEGSLGSWTWEAEYSTSRKEEDTVWHNRTDTAFLSGLNSDGVTGAAIGFLLRVTEAECEARMVELGGWNYTYTPNPFFIGICRIFGQPPDPTNPFGDTSEYIRANEFAGSKNEQKQFEALARGNLFNAPGGPVSVVVGYDFRQDVLDSFKEFLAGDYLSFNTPTGTANFNTRIGRDNSAGFVEGLIPLFGSGNAMAGVQRLSLTFSGRYDSYSDVEVEYRVAETGESSTLDAADPGSEFTWSGGLVYDPTESVRIRGNVGSSFVAPQLNQLLSQVQQSDFALFVYIDADGTPVIQRDNVISFRGGNDSLSPETADNLSLSVEFTPIALPGLLFKAGWSDTEFSNRIVKLRVPVVEDLNNLPPNITYLPDSGIYVIDDRWINSYAVNRSGMDLELSYEWGRGADYFDITLRRSYTSRFDVQQTVISEIVHDLAGGRDDTTQEITTLLPVPKHQTSMQFSWTRGGLLMSLDLHSADDTTILRLPDEHRITKPATNTNLVLGYEFGQDTLFDAPDWMDGLRTSLTITNLTNEFAETIAVQPSTGDTRRSRANLNPAYERTQGRSYRLNLHMSF